MSVNNNLHASMSALAQSNNDTREDSWFEAMAEAWGKALDRQASTIETMSNEIDTAGEDLPSKVSLLTAESLKMSFLSNSSHTAISSIGSSLEAMARKQ